MRVANARAMAARGRGSAGSSSRAPSVAGTALLCVAVAVLLLAATPAAVAGTTYLVGDAAGWTLKVDYGRWVAGKTFHAGDILGTSSVDRLHHTSLCTACIHSLVQQHTNVVF